MPVRTGGAVIDLRVDGPDKSMGGKLRLLSAYSRSAGSRGSRTLQRSITATMDEKLDRPRSIRMQFGI